jgi:hypothetical protein
MSCDNCEQSSAREWHGFTAGCLGCAARAVARGPNWRRCLAAGAKDRLYLEELELYGVSHREVCKAAAADQLEKPR